MEGLTPEEVAHRFRGTLGPERLTEEDAAGDSGAPAQRQAQENHVDDVFDVPVDVVETETGFRHDVALFDQDDEGFVVRTTDPKPPPSARRGLFRRR